MTKYTMSNDKTEVVRMSKVDRSWVQGSSTIDGN